ncbi:nucleotidyl transferase AbiEii/AbiGii toxin family protein [Phytoactinopolyspora alkaliphila]|uniref:Nucleotidyl transferase AbiEii/AbiGii toxin family protein n=1 Tax=Phytoactinopolyspora alkaliphila TaxID=1783498 RepID=A0A6N9YTV7_9ACTN|nr:nucleotidyl transferase AbiEii/AbiGii toxin family protein [Phytoactinopolyspora alkaliphila]
MTPPGPTRETAAGRAYLDLRRLANRHRRQSAEYFTLYALEGFLGRLARSQHAADFVLKGGVLMAAFAARRPTRDIDLAAAGFRNDVHDVTQRVKAIAALDTGDGLVFGSESVSGTVIRDDDYYSW